ncbi:PRC-barrel domain-containing protein [Cupriavidus malaysiensis]|uniref:PRC-barrel domain-containing protein n=1 Tax=Cupriavidus malaysiensis TaxID=367825 RepID=UPI000A045879|nr:PRC-barrel domain-containing protein [Cupriavidus malaysiensis]
MTQHDPTNVPGAPGAAIRDPANVPGASGAEITGSGVGEGPGPDVMAASTLEGNKVYASDGVDIGSIAEIMLDVRSGRIAYAVLSTGGFLGIGDKLHALPWSSLTLDTDAKCFRIHQPSEAIKNAPGFDKNHWPAMAQSEWGLAVHAYYGERPYWINE